MLGDVAPDVAQIGLGGGHVLAHHRPRFEDALHELGLQPVGELALGRLLEQGLDTGHEVEALRVDEHVLLFDSHGERWPRAEAVIEDAGPRPPLPPPAACNMEPCLYPISRRLPTPALLWAEAEVAER